MRTSCRGYRKFLRGYLAGKWDETLANLDPKRTLWSVYAEFGSKPPTPDPAPEF